MRRFSFLLLLSSFYTANSFASPVNDTTIVHTHDGKLLEWNAGRFATDDDTKISYAIDNDGKYLYIGLRIPEMATQMKMMRTGMSVYIDLKGKKKTGRGIEFPVKPDKGQSFTPGDNNARQSRPEEDMQDASKRQLNRVMMRNAMAIKQLNTIRLTGFGGDDEQQVLDVPGSVDVAYKCDTAETMEIEYRIPLSMLGENSKLTAKEISIGCKIHAMEMSPGGFGGGGSGGGMGGMGGGGRMGGGGGGGRMGGRGGQGMGGGMSSGMSRETMMREQSFWTKYTFAGL
jgi:hypothetical protein